LEKPQLLVKQPEAGASGEDALPSRGLGTRKIANLIKWVCTPGRFLKSLSIIVDKRNSLMYFFAAYSTGRIIIFAARVLQKKKNCRIKKSKMI